VRLPGGERERGERLELSWDAPDFLELSLDVRILHTLVASGPGDDAQEPA
jgi:hypothetical protein